MEDQRIQILESKIITKLQQKISKALGEKSLNFNGSATQKMENLYEDTKSCKKFMREL